MPLTVFTNAVQFWLTADLLRVHMPLARAVQITLLSTAANMLPLPGGSVVRIAALKSDDNTYRQGTAATVLVAGNWLGVTLVLAGCALLALGLDRPGASVLVGGILALAAAGTGLRLLHKAELGWMLALVTAQMALVGIGTLRLWLCFRALGDPVAALEAIVLTLSTVIAAAVGVAPAGLGVTEATAAGIAATVGIPASLAFVAAALNRISGLAVVGPLATLLHWIDSRRTPGTAGNTPPKQQ
ncbi:lysylphosphatidylglycerol synthase domain-containing protein [Arhodomonas sp. KWT]|uniref:lysylphosphatidylglycerol synthase domain-containing protein n=1 Tax=Arhodomonas sp. KWT TaxID=2679915 RepID=UPI001969D9AA|nr:lysylphosphatidylglycerol synthase domain-containing protein [Arhodomonas sp. KWT]